MYTVILQATPPHKLPDFVKEAQEELEGAEINGWVHVSCSEHPRLDYYSNHATRSRVETTVHDYLWNTDNVRPYQLLWINPDT